ncbi:MAG: glycine betaine ABC transporter substrate-binding protein [Syntrophomonadaceae bacterium]|nr:glycine betaine ABC transporter substrate-binding protein [Syntrophomonadaceae bacterium]
MLTFQKNLSIKSGILCLFFLASCFLCLSGCGSRGKTSDLANRSQSTKPSIVLADGNWDSIQVHNRIAGLIIKNGYTYPVEYLNGDTLLTWQALSHGDLDIIMEVWPQNNQEAWSTVSKNKSVRILGSNYTGAKQGWYVPAYLVEGDVERGIEPVAPNLKSIYDLSRYAELFGFTDNNKAVIHNGPPGWHSTAINQAKFKAYRLAKNFDLSGSQSSEDLERSLANAYQKARPWVGYGFSPSITAKYKMILLREPAFSPYQWKTTYACAYPETEVLIAANRKLLDKAPEVADFLSKYKTNLEQNEDVLGYMAAHKVDQEAAALYFLNKYPDVWKEWVPEAVALRVENSLLKAPVK